MRWCKLSSICSRSRLGASEFRQAKELDPKLTLRAHGPSDYLLECLVCVVGVQALEKYISDYLALGPLG